MREKATDDEAETRVPSPTTSRSSTARPKKARREPVDDFQREFEKLVQLDQEWRDHFSQTNVPIRQTTEDEEKRQFMFDSLTAGTSLAEFLMEQVRETA